MFSAFDFISLYSCLFYDRENKGINNTSCCELLFRFRPITPLVFLHAPVLCSGRWRIQRYRARTWMILLIPGWLCARRSRARFYLHRSSQGNDCVATSVHLYVGGSPVSRPSTRSPQRPGTRGFQAGSLGRRGAHFPVHSPGVLPLPNTQ